jgi:hypothetical protein
MLNFILKTFRWNRHHQPHAPTAPATQKVSKVLTETTIGFDLNGSIKSEQVADDDLKEKNH